MAALKLLKLTYLRLSTKHSFNVIVIAEIKSNLLKPNNRLLKLLLPLRLLCYQSIYHSFYCPSINQYISLSIATLSINLSLFLLSLYQSICHIFYRQCITLWMFRFYHLSAADRCLLIKCFWSMASAGIWTLNGPFTYSDTSCHLEIEFITTKNVPQVHQCICQTVH